MFSSMNSYGDDAKSLPRRLSNGEPADVYAGTLLIEDQPYDDPETRPSGGSTDPFPLQDLSGFRIISETEGQTFYSRTLGYYEFDANAPGGAKFFDFDNLQRPDKGEDCDRLSARYVNCFTGPSPFEVKNDPDPSALNTCTRPSPVSMTCIMYEWVHPNPNGPAMVESRR